MFILILVLYFVIVQKLKINYNFYIYFNYSWFVVLLLFIFVFVFVFVILVVFVIVFVFISSSASLSLLSTLSSVLLLIEKSTLLLVSGSIKYCLYATTISPFPNSSTIIIIPVEWTSSKNNCCRNSNCSKQR